MRPTRPSVCLCVCAVSVLCLCLCLCPRPCLSVSLSLSFSICLRLGLGLFRCFSSCGGRMKFQVVSGCSARGSRTYTNVPVQPCHAQNKSVRGLTGHWPDLLGAVSLFECFRFSSQLVRLDQDRFHGTSALCLVDVGRASAPPITHVTDCHSKPPISKTRFVANVVRRFRAGLFF